MTTDRSDARRGRIAWRCRRGMRELDLLLGKVLAAGLQTLEDDDLDRLESFLVLPDQDILAWLTGDSKPDDAELRRIVEVLRDRIYSKSEFL